MNLYRHQQEILKIENNEFVYGTNEDPERVKLHLMKLLNMRFNLWIQTGCIYDEENDLFVKPGYGALVCQCGESLDINEVIIEKKREGFKFDDDIGAKYIIGPYMGTSNAIYCTNYIDILSKEFKETLVRKDDSCELTLKKKHEKKNC